MAQHMKSGANGAMDQLLAAAKAVASADKKLDFYHQARREAPAALNAALREREQALDDLVTALLSERESLKQDVLSDGRFEADALREVEFSYQKAVCFAPGQKRSRSRMFFLPCVYWSKSDGGADGVIDFGGDKAQTFSDFVCAFLDEHFGDGQSQSPSVTVHERSLVDWNVQDEEERMLPSFHRALLSGEAFDLDASFPTRAKAMAESEGAGWSLAVLAFAVEHDDEAWLESISFEGYEEDFMEGFEEIFDPSSQLDYDCPCDPTMIQDQAVRLLWTKQVELIVGEMSANKKPKQVGVIESTFVWEDGEVAGIVMDFKIIDPELAGSDDGSDEDVLYHRQVTRPVLVGEDPQDLAAFLVGYGPLIRDDFDVVFGHQFQNSDD